MAKSPNTTNPSAARKARAPQPAKSVEPPFVADLLPADRAFWHVKPSGDFGEDCVTGRRYAVQYLHHLAANDGLPPLQWIVEHMPREMTGIEIGFLTLIGQTAGASAAVGQRISDWYDAKAAEGRS